MSDGSIGSLSFEHRIRHVADGAVDIEPTRAVLVDAATDRVLVDCEGWPASRFVANADGSLFLRLRHKDGDTVFRIDPAARLFRDQGENGPYRPLDELAETVEQLRKAKAAAERDPTYRHISPDGTIRIDTVSVEWGNSQWVQTPRVIDIPSGRIVLDLWNTDWDATIVYPDYRRVTLDFRRYHFSGDLTIDLDLARDTYRITREPGGISPLPSGPLNEAAAAMEASGRRVAAFAAKQNANRPIWNAGNGPGPFAAWRTALVILLVAAVLTTVATVLTERSKRERAQASRLIRPIPQPHFSD